MQFSIWDFLSTEGFQPHGLCLLWRPDVFWAHVVSDLVIAVSYFSIPAALIVFAVKRGDLMYRWVLFLFGAFIIACGITHLFGIWTLWVPDYGVEAILKMVTAVISVSTAIALWPLMPRVLAIPSAHLLEETNAALRREKHERESVEQRLAEASARAHLVAIIDSTDDGIFSLTPDRTVSSWNSGAVKLFGFSEEEMIGRPVDDLIHPDYRDEAAVVSNGVMRGKSVRSFETKLQTLSGNPKDFSITLSPITDENGVSVGMSCIARDISGRKALEAKRNQLAEDLMASNEALERSNFELQQFASVASHDLKEPLRMVSGFTDLLSKRYSDVLDEDGREFIRFAHDGAVRMGQVIDDLLALAHSKRQAVTFEECDADTALATAIADLNALITEAQAEVRSTGLPTVRIAPSLLKLVFQNLIGNAIKFKGDRKPVVSITAATNGHEHVFTVTDNGIGMDPKDTERIFELHERLQDSDLYPGTGIGLTTCRRIVTTHGGRIWVDSRIGEGSSFHFALPATDAEPDECGTPRGGAQE